MNWLLNRFILWVGTAVLSAVLFVLLSPHLPLSAQTPAILLETAEPIAPPVSSPRPENLPPLKPHPLPPTLARWNISDNTGDYFDQIRPTNLGYLVWSQFPVKVYIEPPSNSVTPDRSLVWAASIRQAVREWNEYLPLEAVAHPGEADILVWRTTPRLGRSQGQFRARSAETRYEFFVQRTQNQPPVIKHRFTIFLRPGLSDAQLLAAARHELGHALGIWGHSPLETDVLYYSQVRTPPSISNRDIRTLKKIYEQPTRLGWPAS